MARRRCSDVRPDQPLPPFQSSARCRDKASGRPIQGQRSATPTPTTSSSGGGSGEPTCSRQAGWSGTVQDHLLRSTCIYKTAGGGLVGWHAWLRHKILNTLDKTLCCGGGRWIRTIGTPQFWLPVAPRIYLPQYSPASLATGTDGSNLSSPRRASHRGAVPIGDDRETGSHITRRWLVRDFINVSGRETVKQHTMFCGSFRQVADQMEEARRELIARSSSKRTAS